LIGDQFDRPSNVHGKTGPKSLVRNVHALKSHEHKHVSIYARMSG